MGKGEGIREMWTAAIAGLSNCLFLTKGEVFRESFWRLAIAKVRKYRTRIAAMGRKSPTDAVRAVPILRLLNS